jgi:hypothetical protein
MALRCGVAIVNEGGVIHILNGEDGSVRANYTLSSSGDVFASPVISDLDGDGELELIVGSSDDVLYVFDTLGRNREWPTFQQCLKRAGFYYDSDCRQIAGDLTFLLPRKRLLPMPLNQG